MVAITGFPILADTSAIALNPSPGIVYDSSMVAVYGPLRVTPPPQNVDERPYSNPLTKGSNINYTFLLKL